MKPLTSLFVLLCLCSALSFAEGFSSERLLINKRYEDFLERMETRSSGVLYSSTVPRINQGDKWQGVHSQSKEYFRYERERYARLDVIYGHDIKPASAWRRNAIRSFNTWPELFGTFYQDGFHLYAYAPRSEQFAFSFQPVYGLEVINPGDDRNSISRFTGGFRVEAGYKSKLFAMVDFRDNTEAGNGPYDTRAALYEDRWAAIELKGDNSTSYDISESLIQYYGRNLAVTAGRGRHKWGPSYFGGLLLNDYAPPFDYARFDATFSEFNYTFLHGFLESAIPSDTFYINPDGRPRTINSQKYLSAQRLEVSPSRNTLFGFSQAVIYGDRGVQLGYLTPMNFLYSVQHSNDDKDNLLLSIDGKWRIKPGLKVYGEFLLDDVVVSDIFGNSGGGSKNAYTLGVHGIIPKPFWEKFDARFEYTKVRPFVYSHFFGVNKYTHWTSSLGYTNEPNSEFIHFRLGATFYPLYAAISYERQNHGANTNDSNVGGSIDSPNYADSDAEFVFLNGQFVRTETITISGRYEVLPNLNLLMSVASISQSKLDNRTEVRAGFGWNL
jgi:hypothetical protein